jgi:hypothetical protein
MYQQNMPPQHQQQYYQQQPPQQRYYQQQPPQQPVMPSRPKNESMKTAAIILFVVGFALKFIGFLTLALVIGIIPLLLGAGCDIVAFVCLCLI